MQQHGNIPQSATGLSGRFGPALVRVVAIAILALAVVLSLAACERSRPSPTAAPSRAIVAPRPTVAVADAAATYGDPTFTLRAALSVEGTVVDEGAVVFTIVIGARRIDLPAAAVTAGGATITADMPSGLGAGRHTVEATYRGTARFGDGAGTATLHVAKGVARIAFAPADLARTYDGTARAVGAVTDPPNLSLIVAYARAGVGVEMPLAAGSYGVEARIDDPNYEGAASATLVIARATPTIAWPAPDPLTYGMPLGDAQLRAAASVAGSFVYDPPVGTVLPAGGERGLTATFTPADRDNYLMVTASATVAIAKAPLTVVAVDQERPYGGVNPPLTVALRGFVHGDGPAVLRGTPRVRTEATAASPVGTYRIAAEAGDLAADNYAFTFADGALAVTRAPLTVTANDATRVYGAPDPPLEGALVGVVNDDPIVATYSTAARANSPVGGYPIAVALAAPDDRLANYAVATVPGTLTITPAAVAPTMAALTAHEGDTVLLSARVDPVAPSVATVDEGLVTFVIARDGTIVRTIGPVAVAGGAVGITVALGDLDAGDYLVRATYDGAQNFSPSAGVAALALLNAAPTAAIVGPTVAVPEGGTFTIALTAPHDPSAADNAAGFTYAFDRGDGRGFGAPTSVNTATCRALDDPGGVVRARIFDQHGAWTEYALPVVVANAPPVLGPLTGPTAPVSLGTPLVARAAFVDPGMLDGHTGTWDWGDGTTTQADLETANGSGTASGSHRYARPGIYTLTLALRDDAGATDRARLSSLVVAPSDGGSAAGQIQFTSPTAALVARPAWSGAATLAFVAMPGTTDRPLQVEVAFLADGLSFAGTTTSWLITGEASVHIEGTGTFNGTGGYRFVLSAIDGQGAGVPDRFRLVLVEEASNLIVYDSEPGMPRDGAMGTPEGGDIVVRPRQRDRISGAGEVVGIEVARLLGR